MCLCRQVLVPYRALGSSLGTCLSVGLVVGAQAAFVVVASLLRRVCASSCIRRCVRLFVLSCYRAGRELLRPRGWCGRGVWLPPGRLLLCGMRDSRSRCSLVLLCTFCWFRSRSTVWFCFSALSTTCFPCLAVSCGCVVLRFALRSRSREPECVRCCYVLDTAV